MDADVRWQEIHDYINSGSKEPVPIVEVQTPNEQFQDVLDKLGRGPKQVIIPEVITIPLDPGGIEMQFPKDLINALKNLFTATETFLDPFVKQFASEEGKQLLAIGITEVAAAAADPTLVTNSAKRDAAIAAIGKQALASGITAGETALANTLQAAYTHLNPAAASVTATTPVEPAA